MAESEEEEVPTEEGEEEEEEEVPTLLFEGTYRSTASDVDDVVLSIMAFAAKQMKKSGKFNLAGMLMLKLKVRPAPKARKGVTKEPCVVKAKPASKSAKAVPTIKLK